MTTQTEITQRKHHRAVRFFWRFLIGATAVSLVGNIAHAALPYIPRIVVQIGAATVPPIALLAAVHAKALAVRAGASGRVYRWAVGAVAVIGTGAFAVSFLALRDLMQAIGYSYTAAWIFPAIIGTTVAVSTMMLVALGDKPARRARTVTASANAQPPTTQRLSQRPSQSAKTEVTPLRSTTGAGAVQPEPLQNSAPVQPDPTQALRESAQTRAAQVDVDIAHVDASIASKLIASGVTTQPVETVVAVLAASREGASINAAAKASKINYRTAQRIVEAAAEHRQRQLVAVGRRIRTAMAAPGSPSPPDATPDRGCRASLSTAPADYPHRAMSCVHGGVAKSSALLLFAGLITPAGQSAADLASAFISQQNQLYDQAIC